MSKEHGLGIPLSWERSCSYDHLKMVILGQGKVNGISFDPAILFRK